MILYFPDLNVWLALSDAGNSHHEAAWQWLDQLDSNNRLLFSRYTQIGLLRLLTNKAVMADQVQTLGRAWQIYDHWLGDPRVEFFPEPRGVDATFRKITKQFASQPASKAIGDCWLLAFAIEMKASLVSFDRALYSLARKEGQSAVIPA
jgi:toxin-antitoxin system PIN domain toxin